ncbi:DUF4244 domain-containing protein [Arthrobacter sp. GMC3]|uniref:DUF4244 domain-containing protein n=1 Tax=Arthrobacter sp. GMC3 TaxID=2058894 RepID=UPI000CE537CD|nr:DUF4244 domain-containing protein [Arthrobacter sp. GMC3]
MDLLSDALRLVCRLAGIDCNPWAVIRVVELHRSTLVQVCHCLPTVAAVGFAGLLVVILKSDEVRGFLLNIIRSALSF